MSTICLCELGRWSSLVSSIELFVCSIAHSISPDWHRAMSTRTATLEMCSDESVDWCWGWTPAALVDKSAVRLPVPICLCRAPKVSHRDRSVRGNWIISFAYHWHSPLQHSQRYGRPTKFSYHTLLSHRRSHARNSLDTVQSYGCHR